MGVKQRIEKLESKRPCGVRLNPKAIIICGVSPDGKCRPVTGYSIQGTNINIMRDAGETVENLLDRSVIVANNHGRPAMFIEISKERI